jgi:hypothetical protein
LKPTHVEALLGRWKSEDLSAATMKNRLAALRWWAEKIGKENVFARENDSYGVERRQFVTNREKGKDLDPAQVDKVASPFVAMSLRLQEAFGLRREESIKIRPAWADQGNALRLKDSWTKGARAGGPDRHARAAGGPQRGEEARRRREPDSRGVDQFKLSRILPRIALITTRNLRVSPDQFGTRGL